VVAPTIQTYGPNRQRKVDLSVVRFRKHYSTDSPLPLRPHRAMHDPEPLIGQQRLREFAALRIAPRCGVMADPIAPARQEGRGQLLTIHHMVDRRLLDQ
jgi:hypothetical protein